MDKSKEVPTRLISKIVSEGGDATSGLLLLGVWGEVIPAVLGVFGIAWFGLRFVNFVRVNIFGKEPWGMR